MGSIFKTTILLGALTGLLMLIGGLVGGRHGVQIALIFAVAMNFFSYWFSDKMVLAAYGAKPIDASSAPEVFAIVQELALQAHIPMPRLYLIDSDTPNAFATGRNPNHAAVAVTRGIMRICTRDELKGVLAHELSHVINRDILTSSIAATLAGAVMMLGTMARWGAIFGGFGGRDEDERGGIIGLVVAAILAPIAASLDSAGDFANSRISSRCERREALASSALLANALRKLENANERMPLDAGPATAHLFIVNPLSAEGMYGCFRRIHQSKKESAGSNRCLREGPDQSNV